MLKRDICLILTIVPFIQAHDGPLKKIESYVNKLDYNSAITLCHKFIAKDSLNSKVYYYRAWCFRKNGSYDKAFKDINRSIQLNEKSSEAFTELGTIFAMTGDYDLAIENYDKAIALDSKNPRAFSSKGGVYFQFLYDDSLASVNYKKALSLDTNNVYALYNLGALLESEENYLTAIPLLTKAITLHWKLHKAYHVRGKCFYQINEHKKAIEDLKMAIKYNEIPDPNDRLDLPELYKWLFKCYSETGNAKMAKYYYEKSEK